MIVRFYSLRFGKYLSENNTSVVLFVLFVLCHVCPSCVFEVVVSWVNTKMEEQKRKKNPIFYTINSSLLLVSFDANNYFEELPTEPLSRSVKLSPVIHHLRLFKLLVVANNYEQIPDS